MQPLQACVIVFWFVSGCARAWGCWRPDSKRTRHRVMECRRTCTMNLWPFAEQVRQALCDGVQGNVPGGLVTLFLDLCPKP